MRLTLRTLLAYLDDTLEPSEIREIGQKVAESDAAQELVARIKQVTRRRRLTTPPATGPNARFDANTVAEYLDSALAAEPVAEVEKTCLESDVHLAEIAACHQILTLVLGEPALVPPTAKRRMYTLVRGREAISRKPQPRSATGNAAPAGRHDGDETLLLGLPPLGRAGGKKLRWLVPAAALLLVAGVALAIYMAIPRPKDTSHAKGPLPTPPVNSSPHDKNEPQPVEEDEEFVALVIRVEKTTVADAKPIEIKPQPLAPSKPSTERRAVGRVSLDPAAPSVLLQQRRDKGEWHRVRPTADLVYTDDLLVSLPGYRSEVRLDNKLELLLWANVEEQLDFVLQESAVTLHAVSPAQPGTPDLDFTLDRGRVLITNSRNGPALVRVRFHQEVWDVTLVDPGAEVGVDLWGRDTGFETGELTLAALSLFVVKGNVKVRINYDTHALQAPPGPAQFVWDNLGRGAIGPLPHRELPPIWTKSLPAIWQWQNLPLREQEARKQTYDAMRIALDELRSRLTDKTGLGVVLAENLRAPRPMTRILAVRCLGAIDALPELLDALGNEEHADVRETAVASLRHWLGRRDGQDKKLRQALADKRYTTNQADTILQLLHSFTPKAQREKQTYEVLIEYLRHDKPEIRQLAYWHLSRLAPEARQIPYNPGAGVQERQDGYLQWKKLLGEGKLPPKLPPMPN